MSAASSRHLTFMLLSDLFINGVMNLAMKLLLKNTEQSFISTWAVEAVHAEVSHICQHLVFLVSPVPLSSLPATI